jgi:hypothetical protein
MTTTQKLIVAFWVIILLTAAWQFYTYNEKLSQPTAAAQAPQHFYFYPPGSRAPDQPPPAGPTAKPGADVRQTAYSVDLNKPTAGFMTCHVTLKNFGLSKALNIQVKVRPYRGATNEDGEASFQPKVYTLPDDDPISQIGDYVSFPDLAPGESETRDVQFAIHTEVNPGTNPNPDIIFETDKSAPAPAPTPRPSSAGGGD